jgi:hypothetical protein
MERSIKDSSKGALQCQNPFEITISPPLEKKSKT